MTLLAKIRGEGPRGASAAVDNPNRSDQLLAPLLSVCRQPAINNMFLTVRRFPAVHDLSVLGDVPSPSDCGREWSPPPCWRAPFT